MRALLRIGRRRHATELGREKDVGKVELYLRRNAARDPVLDTLYASVGFVVPEKYSQFGRPTQLTNEFLVGHDAY